jgi:hypothetical protein
LDSIELLKNIALKIKFDHDKSLCGVLIMILLKICERSNKILTKQAHESISVIIKANLNLISSTIPLIIDFGRNSSNKFVRQICIEIIKELIESFDEPKILDSIFNVAGKFIRYSTTDSCDLVRATSRKIIDYFKKYEISPFLKIMDSENSQKIHISKNIIESSPKNIRKSSDRNTTSFSVQKPKGLGKAQRVKNFP